MVTNGTIRGDIRWYERPVLTARNPRTYWKNDTRRYTVVRAVEYNLYTMQFRAETAEAAD